MSTDHKRLWRISGDDSFVIAVIWAAGRGFSVAGSETSDRLGLTPKALAHLPPTAGPFALDGGLAAYAREISYQDQTLGPFVVVFNRHDPEAAIASANVVGLRLWVLGFCFAAILSVFAITSITAPLKRIAGMIQAVSRRELDFASEDTSRRDEFGTIARAIVQLRDSLAGIEWLTLSEAAARERAKAANRDHLIGLASWAILEAALEGARIGALTLVDLDSFKR